MKPLAQTFYIDKNQYKNGMYLTSVDIFFKSAPASGGYPVRLEIMGVENDIPNEVPYPGSAVFKAAADVNVPLDVNSLTDIAAAATNFAFEEPMFLSPGKEYAVTLWSNSDEYELYIGRTYEFLVGTTDRRLIRQSGLGRLFHAQSGSMWTPDYGVDLVMKLYRASFTTSVTKNVYLENNEPPKRLLSENPLNMTSSDATIRVSHLNHGFIKDDYVAITGLDSATKYANIDGSDIMGERQITSVDWTGYTFEADSIANATISIGGTTVKVSDQVMINEYIVNAANIKPLDTTIATGIKMITGLSFANGRNTSTSGGYVKPSSYTNINPNQYIYNDGPQLIATVKNENNATLAGEKSATVQFGLFTDDSAVSPLIDLQRVSISATENVIDKQDSAATTGYNVPLVYVAETDPQDGSSASKHISKPVVLAEQAVGLKIILAANRPTEADFVVYWRVSSGDEVITDKAWTSVSKESIIPPDADPTVFREYTYLVGGIGGNLSPFTQFQVKIVMTSTNTSKIPRIKDLRTIALVV
jgi:hypothetical protein